MFESLGTITFKIILTVFLSGFIGLEREFRRKMAGLRTHILVGVGSASIVITSHYFFATYNHVTPVDPTRLITGVVTGIGFLCGGAIIKAGDSVIGLTTAATLWIVSCIGIAVGAGQYDAAIVVSLVVFLVLTFVRYIEVYLIKNREKN